MGRGEEPRRALRGEPGVRKCVGFGAACSTIFPPPFNLLYIMMWDLLRYKAEIEKKNVYAGNSLACGTC